MKQIKFLIALMFIGVFSSSCIYGQGEHFQLVAPSLDADDNDSRSRNSRSRSRSSRRGSSGSSCGNYGDCEDVCEDVYEGDDDENFGAIEACLSVNYKIANQFEDVLEILKEPTEYYLNNIDSNVFASFLDVSVSPWIEEIADRANDEEAQALLIWIAQNSDVSEALANAYRNYELKYGQFEGLIDLFEQLSCTEDISAGRNFEDIACHEGNNYGLAIYENVCGGPISCRGVHNYQKPENFPIDVIYKTGTGLLETVALVEKVSFFCPLDGDGRIDESLLDMVQDCAEIDNVREQKRCASSREVEEDITEKCQNLCGPLCDKECAELTEKIDILKRKKEARGNSLASCRETRETTEDVDCSAEQTAFDEAVDELIEAELALSRCNTSCEDRCQRACGSYECVASTAFGSGVFVNDNHGNQRVMTNHHVIDYLPQIYIEEPRHPFLNGEFQNPGYFSFSSKIFFVTSYSGDNSFAEVLRCNKDNDVAVLKLRDSVSEEVRTADPEDFNRLNARDKIISIGQPDGRDWVISQGFLRGRNADINCRDCLSYDFPDIVLKLPVKLFPDIPGVAHDQPGIIGGSSGGPIFNEQGKLVGLIATTAVLGNQSRGWAYGPHIRAIKNLLNDESSSSRSCEYKDR